MEFFDARFAAFLAIAALLIMTPGPDTALVTRNALLAGRRAASFTTFGIGLGSIVWALASVLGIAVLLESSAIAFTLFKFVGGAYLAYLGLRSLISSFRAGKHAAATRPDPKLTELHNRTAFSQGLLSNLLNPKAGAIFVTVFPQFINPGDTPIRLCLMMLAYEAILLVWLNIYGYLISHAGRSRAGARVRQTLNRITGVVLIALGVRFVFERQ